MAPKQKRSKFLCAPLFREFAIFAGTEREQKPELYRLILLNGGLALSLLGLTEMK